MKNGLSDIVLSGDAIYQKEFVLTDRDFENTSGVLSDVGAFIKTWYNDPNSERSTIGRVWNDLRYQLKDKNDLAIKYYRYTGGKGSSSASDIDNDLSLVFLKTVSPSKLQFVAKNVENPNRYFSLTENETGFIPIWIEGTPQPRSPKQTTHLGCILYTPRGEWYIRLNMIKLRKAYLGHAAFQVGDVIRDPKIVDNLPTINGENILQRIQPMFSRKGSKFDPNKRKLLDLGFEYMKDNGAHSAFKRVSKDEYYENIGSLFESWNKLSKRGVTPIQKIKVLDPNYDDTL